MQPQADKPVILPLPPEDFKFIYGKELAGSIRLNTDVRCCSFKGKGKILRNVPLADKVIGEDLKKFSFTQEQYGGKKKLTTKREKRNRTEILVILKTSQFCSKIAHLLFGYRCNGQLDFSLIFSNHVFQHTDQNVILLTHTGIQRYEMSSYLAVFLIQKCNS